MGEYTFFSALKFSINGIISIVAIGSLMAIRDEKWRAIKSNASKIASPLSKLNNFKFEIGQLNRPECIYLAFALQKNKHGLRRGLMLWG